MPWEASDGYDLVNIPINYDKHDDSLGLSLIWLIRHKRAEEIQKKTPKFLPRDLTYLGRLYFMNLN